MELHSFSAVYGKVSSARVVKSGRWFESLAEDNISSNVGKEQEKE